MNSLPLVPIANPVSVRTGSNHRQELQVQQETQAGRTDQEQSMGAEYPTTGEAMRAVGRKEVAGTC